MSSVTRKHVLRGQALAGRTPLCAPMRLTGPLNKIFFNSYSHFSIPTGIVAIDTLNSADKPRFPVEVRHAPSTGYFASSHVKKKTRGDSEEASRGVNRLSEPHLKN